MRGARIAKPLLMAASGFCMGLLLSACSMYSATATFTPTMQYARSTRGPNEIQLIFLGNQPARSFVRVAQLNAGRPAMISSDQALMDAIRQEAARIGLDGVVDLECGPGWERAWQCIGIGFVYQR